MKSATQGQFLELLLQAKHYQLLQASAIYEITRTFFEKNNPYVPGNEFPRNQITSDIDLVI